MPLRFIRLEITKPISGFNIVVSIERLVQELWHLVQSSVVSRQ